MTKVDERGGWEVNGAWGRPRSGHGVPEEVNEEEVNEKQHLWEKNRGGLETKNGS
jgi:hypothetical protein